MKVLNALVPIGVVLAAVSGIAFRSDGKVPTNTNEVIVRPGEGGCVLQSMNGAEITEVRQVVLPQIGIDAREGATTTKVRQALIERYGSRVSEELTPMGYRWVWNPVIEQWVQICMAASKFTIDFGALGSVVVESQDSMLPREPGHSTEAG